MSQQPRHGDGNDGKPDTLRDARLAHALKHMPDAHMQPDPQARSAVLQAALKALEDGPATPKQANSAVDTQPQADRAPGWRKAWHWLLGQPGQRMPLSGALASLLIASFGTVMWLGQDLPDANPESVPVAEANYGGKTEKAAQAENATASPSNTTAQQAVEPPQASAPPAARAVLTPAPAAAPAPSPTAAPAVPPAQGLAPPPVAVAAPKVVAGIQSAANLPAPPPPPPAPAKESTAERSDARPQSAQMTQMAPMADAAKPAAKMVAPAPAAPAVAATAAPSPVLAPAPAPAVAAAPAAPSPLAESAARARRDAAASPGLQVVLDGQRRTLTAAQSASLLATLRALPWQVESSRAGVAIGHSGHSGQSADGAAPFTVQTPDGERWDINTSSVRTSTAGGLTRTSPLTPAQWLQLRALATPAAP